MDHEGLDYIDFEIGKQGLLLADLGDLAQSGRQRGWNPLHDSFRRLLAELVSGVGVVLELR